MPAKIYQHTALNGEKILNPEMIDETLRSIFKEEYHEVPDGLIGICTDSGLVYVRQTPLSDTKVLMKAGKAIRKTMGDDIARELSSKISSYVKIMKGAELEIAESSDDIIWVYQNGPRSCMRNSDSVAVYGGPDTSVAFVRAGDRVVARTVLNLRENTYIRIYGNQDLILPLLEEAGFDCSGDLDGCELLRLENDYGEVMMPYLDCGTSVNEHHDRLEVCNGGEYSSRSEDGLLKPLENCSCCGSSVQEDEQHWSDDAQEHYCYDCFFENHIEYECEWYHIESSDVHLIESDNTHYHVDQLKWSDYEQKYFRKDDVTHVEFHQDYIPNNKVVTAITDLDYMEGEKVHMDDCTDIDGVWVFDDITGDYEALKDTQMSLFGEE